MTEPTAPPSKRPWELHAIVAILALLVGYAVSQANNFPPRDHHVIVLLCLPVCLIGLFRGRLVAWWAMAFAFLFASLAAGWHSVELIGEYGFRLHPKLLREHALTLSCIGVFALLMTTKMRGSFPPPARPLGEDLPAFVVLAAFAAPVLLVIAAIGSVMIVALFVPGRGASGERYLSTTLKTLSSAQADFRANDRDWNHVNDFWVGDVAGLYGIVPKETPNATSIKLIELSTAAADADPIPGVYPPTPAQLGPRAGGWFQVLRKDRSMNPPEPYRVDGSALNTGKFGFVAYPDDYVMSYKYILILNEYNTIYRQRLKDDVRPSGRTPPGPLKNPHYMDWPPEDELKAKWSKLD